MNKCYSTDGENYIHTELGEVLYEINYKVGTVIHEACYKHPAPSSMFRINDMIENMQERADDEYGEYAEDFMYDLTEEQVKELDDLISNWLDKNVKVSFFQVYDVKEVVVTEEMVKLVKEN